MQVSWKVARRIGIGLALGLLATWLIVRTWVIPALIAAELRSLSGGAVTIGDWWLNARSSGVSRLVLHRGDSRADPAWATAEAVETDLSLGSLLRGRFSPRRVVLRSPRLTLRLDRDGRILDLPAFEGAGGSDRALPTIRVEQGVATFRPEGRPEMSITRIDAELKPGPEGSTLNGRADDPTWGRWTARGSIARDLGTGSVRLDGPRFVADRATLDRIAFVPTVVWSHVVPEGPVDVAITLEWAPASASATTASSPFRARAEVTLRETPARFPSLDLAATRTTGRLEFADGVLSVRDASGEALGGRINAHGTLDFARRPPRFAIGLDLRAVNVADMPRSWQLGEAGITGQLTGQVQLRAELKRAGIDLTGSEGEAVVEGGTIEGIPVKSLRLVMRAEGSELQYQTEQKPKVSDRGEPESLFGPRMGYGGNTDRAERKPVLVGWAPPTMPFEGIGGRCPPYEDRNLVRLKSGLLTVGLVALQSPPPDPKESEPETKPKPEGTAKKGGFLLPRTITTRIELEDVDMAQVVAKAQFMIGFPFPLPVQGKLSLKADATIPIGRLRDVKAYVIHGDVTLKNTSLARLDVGRASARVDLEDGRLDIKDLRGWLVDHPGGGPDNPPHPTAEREVPESGPLPTGAFRGDLHAELSPPGAFTARFEANELPLGELSAPVLPRPTPVSGLASFQLEGKADLARAGDPKAWDVSGQGESRRITYRGAVLDRVAVEFHLKEGTLNIPEVTALLKGQPLRSQGTLTLNPPYPFHGTLNVTHWDLDTLATLIPSIPQPSPLAGTIDAGAKASGTLSPLAVETTGQGHLGRFRAGLLPIGDVPFRWTSEANTIKLRVDDARPFGGKLDAEARVPIVDDKPTEGSARFEAIDTARLSDAIADRSLTMTGKASGSLTFKVPRDVSRVNANLRLDAPDLTIQGIPTEHLQADLQARRGVVHYEATADSLGGKVRFRGDVPIAGAKAGEGADADSATTGHLQFVGFQLDALARAVDTPGMAGRIKGLGALDANLRALRSGRDAGLWLHGISEFRDLNWLVPRVPLGRFRAIITVTPGGWRVEPISGELLGGVASGSLRGANPPTAQAQAQAQRLGFEFNVSDFPLTRVLEFVPELTSNVAVAGRGSLRMAGTLGEMLRSQGTINVPHGEVSGLPLRELRIPVELALTPASGAGTLQVRRGSARLAGGQVHGDAWFRLGHDRAFQSNLNLTSLELESITRLAPEVRRPATGRISGRINLEGPDPSQQEKYRGKVVLDLTDASLISVPVFRELDRMLGSASGGLFEDGDLIATIANRHLIIETFTLDGRLAQVHATGTVGFDGQLDLDVLVNTDQIIPQTGEALVRVIPGLSEVVGRRDRQATLLRVGNFLSNRLLKLRVTGTLRNPTINANPGLVVAETAAIFFSGVLRLPLGALR